MIYLWVIGSIIFSYQDEVGVMIENEKIFSLLKSAFDDHWQRTN